MRPFNLGSHLFEEIDGGSLLDNVAMWRAPVDLVNTSAPALVHPTKASRQ